MRMRRKFDEDKVLDRYLKGDGGNEDIFYDFIMKNLQKFKDSEDPFVKFDCLMSILMMMSRNF